MLKIRCSILLLMIFSFTLIFPQEAGSIYPGGKKPERKAEIFAPGLISTSAKEYGVAVNKDWTEIYFTSLRGENSRILLTKRVGNNWNTPVVTSFSNSGNDSHPFLFPGENKIGFCSLRPCKESNQRLNLWYSEKINGDWGAPKSFKGPFLKQTVHAASISDNGHIYFTGLKILKNNSEGYQSAEKLLPNIKGSHPAVSPDGSYIIFSSRGEGSFGSADLWITVLQKNGRWSKPENLGPNVNSGHLESSPTISMDGEFLFFSRQNDIWWISTDVIKDKLK